MRPVRLANTDTILWMFFVHGRSDDRMKPTLTVWFLVGNGGMGYGDYYWGLYRDYYRDQFPHSLLSTRQLLSTVLGFLRREPALVGS